MQIFCGGVKIRCRNYQSYVNSGKIKLINFSFRLGLDIFTHVRKIERNLEGEFSSTEEQNDEAPIESGNALLYEPLVVCNSVNFFLCSEDIDHILSTTELRDVFGSDPFLQQYERTIHRRNSALLGSDFLAITRCSINFDRARFFFDPLILSLEGCSWTTFEDLCDEIKKMRYLKSGTVYFEVQLYLSIPFRVLTLGLVLYLGPKVTDFYVQELCARTLSETA